MILSHSRGHDVFRFPYILFMQIIIINIGWWYHLAHYPSPYWLIDQNKTP